VVEDPIQWVRAAQAGDREAFDRLIGLHGKALLRYLLNVTGSAANADDVAQEAWLQAYRSIGQLNDPANFQGWLLRIAYHRWLKWVRKRKPAADLSPEELAQTPAKTEEAAGPGELDDAVRKAVQQLPEDQRTVVTLRFGEGLSHAQIAEVTGDEVATVRWRLFMARQALQRRLKAWAPENSKKAEGSRQKAD
jgi:RNA polymerase sigma-70 factor (ECF subfamily)